MDVVAATEAPSLAPEVAPVRVTAPSSGSSTAAPAAATSQSAARPTSVESNPQAAVVAPTGREAEPPSQPPPSELTLLKRMHVALREADYGAVMALCAEHERRWPHGVFEFEREGVRAIAACGANSDDAIPRAQRFLATHPHTPIAMRVSSACVARLPK